MLALTQGSQTSLGSQTSSLMLSQGPSSSALNTPHKMLALTQGSPSGFSGTSQASASTPCKTSPLIPVLPVMPQDGDSHNETEKSTSMAILSPGTISEATSAPGVTESRMVRCGDDDATANKAPASSDDAVAVLPPPPSDSTKKVNNRKRSRPSSGSKTAKKLFAGEDDDGAASAAVAPRDD